MIPPDLGELVRFPNAERGIACALDVTNILPCAAVRSIVFVIRRECAITLFQRNIFINTPVDCLFANTTSAVSQLFDRARPGRRVDAASVWIDRKIEFDRCVRLISETACAVLAIGQLLRYLFDTTCASIHSAIAFDASSAALLRYGRQRSR
jgi:hypothetical protein